MLGPVTVVTGGRQHRIPRAQTRGLLALMLLNLGRRVSREAVIEAMWGGTPPSTARSQVHNAVTVIRGRLAEIGAPEVFASDPSGYELLVEPHQVDAARFDERVRLARDAAARGEAKEAVRLLRGALDLWTGEPLADATGSFVDAARARLVERRLTAVEDLADLELDLGRAEAIAAELAPLVDAHPMRERLRVRQMTALYRSGRQVEALQTYRVYRNLLAEHEGLDPGREIAELERLILRADSGLATPQTVAAPALLPPDIPDFTGRDAAVDDLRKLLTDGRPAAALAIAGVAGMGGVGKTTLAVHVAHQAAPAYPDGQLYANLRGAEAVPLDAADVLARFLRALGVDSRAIPEDVVERAELYRTRLAGRRVLVVLDNAASEEQVRPLLPGAASCAVLVTSRARLTGVEGARWIDLEVFASGEAIRLLGRVTGDDRVATQPADAAEIVRLCGGLPLAVRVAGARLTARPSWRLAHLAGMLRDERRRLDRLATGDLEVRASLALSYDGLDGATRLLFRRLGLFDVPDFPGWLAGAVLDGPADAAAHLEALFDAQLLAAAGVDAAGQIRYRFHDLVRLYAQERAEIEDPSQERTHALERGFAAWLGVAERMAAQVPGPCYAAIGGSVPRPPVDWPLDDVDPLQWFDAERAALLPAVRQACELGLDELAFDLAGRLEKYFDIRGMYADWNAINTLVLGACRRAGNRLGAAVMLRGLIDVVTWNTTPEGGDATTRFHTDAFQLLEMFTELAEPRGMSDAAVMCSWALTAQAAYPEAVDYGTRALRLAEESGHKGGEARAHVALALARGEQLDIVSAIQHLHHALAAARALGNPRYESAVLQFLGIAHREAGDLDASEQRLGESLAISHRYRDNYTKVLTMLALARLHLRRGDPQARSAAESSLALGREYNMTHHVADALGVLGEIELAGGDPERAVAYLEESVAMWRTRGWLSFLAAALVSLGRAYAAAGSPAADGAFAEAQEIATRLGRNGSGQ
ncbi:SARP family transcriptional regulator [Phytohabitans rumicis]|uniref:SARP family transcriptional regulator n=1 Tax=Phytohabitans rumicis TaxID=1076125 RepID=A0A6V8KZ38_9ACTN|nr:SARP family transcriptional regulator [Phytohabitans rumicis]